jgi:tellurite resistance protein TehA-like permease
MTMPRDSINQRFSASIRDLFPGYFAMVMATGIVSIACYLIGIGWLSRVLFFINVFAYLILLLMTALRLIRYPHNLALDMISYTQGAGFFTLIAGTAILGSQFVVIYGSRVPSIILWIAGLVFWIILTCVFFTAVTVRSAKPTLDAGISGGWLITVVGTQSISVLASLIATKFGLWQQPLLFGGLAFYCAGCGLYLILIALIFYRLVFFRLEAEQFTPLYWINMGAAAITTLAGSRLILAAQKWTFLQDILPFLKGFTFFFWSMASWWLILLIVIMGWFYLYKRFRLKYEAQFWGLVFPLGMYTACSFTLGQGTSLPFLENLARGFIYIALLAWLVTFVGFLLRLGKIGLNVRPKKTVVD